MIQQDQLEAPAPPKWEPSVSGDVLVRADGLILGEVIRAWDTGYHAHFKGAPIGTYYKIWQAMRAVERAAGQAGG